METVIASLILLALIIALGLVFAFYLIVMARDKSIKDWSSGRNNGLDDN